MGRSSKSPSTRSAAVPAQLLAQPLGPAGQGVDHVATPVAHGFHAVVGPQRLDVELDRVVGRAHFAATLVIVAVGGVVVVIHVYEKKCDQRVLITDSERIARAT